MELIVLIILLAVSLLWLGYLLEKDKYYRKDNNQIISNKDEINKKIGFFYMMIDSRTTIKLSLKKYSFSDETKSTAVVKMENPINRVIGILIHIFISKKEIVEYCKANSIKYFDKFILNNMMPSDTTTTLLKEMIVHRYQKYYMYNFAFVFDKILSNDINELEAVNLISNTQCSIIIADFTKFDISTMISNNTNCRVFKSIKEYLGEEE